MTKYIPIDDVPRSSRASKWPYREWADIPDGFALEITDQLDGASVRSVRWTAAAYFTYHKLPLVAIMRGDRLFIAKKKDES